MYLLENKSKQDALKMDEKSVRVGGLWATKNGSPLENGVGGHTSKAQKTCWIIYWVQEK